MSTAESRLEHLVKSVLDRTITVETLELLDEHSNQFLVLGKIIQKFTKIREQGQVIPINEAFKQRSDELHAFLHEKTMLNTFMYFCEFLKSGSFILLVFNTWLTLLFTFAPELRVVVNNSAQKKERRLCNAHSPMFKLLLHMVLVDFFCIN